jgi:hypothetical protein
MPAPAKFTRRRERRLLTLIEGGATIAEACRAVEISRQALYDRARDDVLFGERLRDAREQRTPALDSIDALDWREAARRLEADDPLRWALKGSGEPFDPLDGESFDPLADPA